MDKTIAEKGKKTRFKAGEKQVELARKAGKKSGEAKRAKKELRECLEILLERVSTDKKGVSMSGAEKLALKLFEKAEKGDVKAFEVLRDTAGQKPVDKVITTDFNVSLDLSDLDKEDE